MSNTFVVVEKDSLPNKQSLLERHPPVLFYLLVSGEEESQLFWVK